MKLIGYVRVSTEDQAANGFSLDAQERAIRAWCEAMGHELVHVFREEGSSARTLDRPGLICALNTLFGLPLSAGGVTRFWPDGVLHADGLVVFKLDRLTRSLKDLCDLLSRFEASGKALVSVRDSLDTQTSTGRMMVQMLGVFAEFESAQISERVKAGMAEAKRQGKHVGRPRKRVE